MSLPAATVLDLWEAGVRGTPAARAELLLEAVGEPDVRDWTIGRRDLALLEAYCGTLIEAVVDCPTCGSALEVTVDRGELRHPGAGGPVVVSHDGYTVTARPPIVSDLHAVARDGAAGADVDGVRRTLLDRCVVEASYDGLPVTADDLPAQVADRVEEALDDADPVADIRLAMVCDDCGGAWWEAFDPVVFAWSAVETAARGVATDVHTLARAYGWSEREILGLTAFRRHLYLSAVDP